MLYSQLFIKTKREAPSDLTDETLRLAFRAGLIRPAERGEIIYLPLAANVISQMRHMLRADLRELGAHEIRGAPHLALDAFASAEIQSYKQLPAHIYWRSGGVTRLHVASFEASHEAAEKTRRVFLKIARDFFEYTRIAPQRARDTADARVWYLTAPARDLEVFTNAARTYAATRAVATPLKPAVAAEAPLPRQEVATPHCDTIEALARFLNVAPSRTAKAVFYASEGRVIFAVIRGDLQIDEDKVKRALGVPTLRWATNDEIARVGALPGFASPIGTRGATIVIDDSILNSPNLVAGANKADYHFLNTNVPRDYTPNIVTDIALARVGDASPEGDGALELVRGIELGRVSAPCALAANFLDVNGKTQKPIAVTMELDLGAILLAHIGAHHDDKGILWARTIAPYDVCIVALNADKPEVADALAQVKDALLFAGLEALVDDRSESAGVKFNDADLIGLPLRITVGPKTVAQNAIEFKPRQAAAARLVTLDALAQELEQWTNST